MQYEKELRKRSFLVMANHLEIINDSSFLLVGDVADMLKVSKPTARKFLNGLVSDGKMDYMIAADDDTKTKRYFFKYGQWTSKDWEQSRKAYSDLMNELVG